MHRVILFYPTASLYFLMNMPGNFDNAMNGMIEMQLRLSIQDVANYWYTAWVDAGSPELLSLDDENLTKQNRKNYKIEYKAWNKGKLLNLSVDKE